MSFDLLIVSCLAYVVLLFMVAFAAERRAKQGRQEWVRSSLVYTLSLSVYCTAWTFYGAVGNAARSGLEYLTIYLGPTLVLLAWWLILRKLVRIGRTQRITSIADLIAARFGKSNGLGVIVTLIAVAGTTPYIALQLQSVTLSFAVFTQPSGSGFAPTDPSGTAFWVAVGLALFTILFGTRNLDANERHHGVVMAIAVEAVVKLLALIAVGVFVVWGVADGPADIMARIEASPIATWELSGARWVGLTFLSAAAILCLPRMFQVLVVENADEAHLATASWAFPLYLLLMSLFVVPIAVIGLDLLPQGANPDLFVLSIPLSEGQGGLAMLAFLGGFSSATSMVIVAAIALSTMVSNHIVMPIYLSFQKGGATIAGDVRKVVLISRRTTIIAVLLLGYLYYRLSSGAEALAAIGLISFAGVAQVLPILLGGLFWRGATRTGAAFGLITGFTVWAYALFLPSFGESGVISAAILTEGPWGLSWLRPQALFGIDGMDPLVHALFWSIALNTLAFCAISIITFPTPLERLQAARLVDVFAYTAGTRGWARGTVETEDLMIMTQRILGPSEAQALFQAEAERQGTAGYLPDASPEFLERLERRLSGSVGSATAHAMVGQIAGNTEALVEDLIRVAGEAQQILEYSQRLEQKSTELSRTAGELQRANEKLTALSVQKDAFLSQISHELRTPMASIRSFSEILRDESLTDGERTQFVTVIHDETLRLTRLLDDLLNLSVLENAQVTLNIGQGTIAEMIDRAVMASGVKVATPVLRLDRRKRDEQIVVETDTDRLTQVFINLIGNAQKYCDAAEPVLRIRVSMLHHDILLDFMDNGSGIPSDSQALIFEKFSRLTDSASSGGAGLGLAICREIMGRLGGAIDYMPGQSGAAFRVRLPMRAVQAA
ncbi:sensor histidine kinase [Actibacterium sp. 188UL27-1]|uniref:sensor histidine kinase n=1 Tax=Actibacterium sp. 188UL27-1 TaxID=2786961 RepID=UPI00195932A2|nr:sensor histidine kinase [Actibacterium sp. 188UL27-1]MBM7068334.1 sodium:solute symporter [Actibacterium sp. 188UL27-1]